MYTVEVEESLAIARVEDSRLAVQRQTTAQVAMAGRADTAQGVDGLLEEALIQVVRLLSRAFHLAQVPVPPAVTPLVELPIHIAQFALTAAAAFAKLVASPQEGRLT